MPNLTKQTRERWAEQMQSEYPHLPTDFIALVLDLYDNDKDFLDQFVKEEKKKNKGKPLEAKKQLTVDELERLGEISKAKIEETIKNTRVSVTPAVSATSGNNTAPADYASDALEKICIRL